MILSTVIELGVKEQTLYSIDDKGNIKSVARIELDNLPDAICGFYYGYDGHEVHILGPEQMCTKVAEEVKEISSTLYADKEPIRIIIN